MSVTLSPTGAAANAPRANWANANAGPVLRVLDPCAEPWGELAAEAIPSALRRVVRALNIEGARLGMTREPSTGGRWLDLGSDDGQARRRLEQAAEVLRFAARAGTGVSWD